MGLDRSVVAIVEHVQDAALFDGFDDGGVHVWHASAGVPIVHGKNVYRAGC